MAIALDPCGQTVLSILSEFAAIRLASEGTRPIVGEAIPFFDSRGLGCHRKARGMQGTE